MIVGIDLGTGNSCIAVKQGTDITIIPNKEGQRTMPSVVAFAKNGDKLVGQLAKRQAITNPENTVEFIKRKMGTTEKVKLNGRDYTPQQISAMILQKLKTDAEEYLGEPIKDAVITVPAYFDDNARTATKDAGTIAGLNVVRIINEPTAACLAYGLGNGADDGEILVVDAGCGTTDFSIIDIDEGVFEVVGTSGDNYLGGSDWDKKLSDYVVSEFKKSNGIDLSRDKTAMQRVMEAAEKAKIELTTRTETVISLPFISATSDGPVHLEMTVTRSTFENITADLVERFKKPLYKLLKDTALTYKDIDKILMVGGSTRMPMLQKAVMEIMHTDNLVKGINPDECVAMGAAIQGAVLSGEQKGIILVDVVPLSLGITIEGGRNMVMIEKNTAIPISKKDIFSTCSDNQSAVTIEVNQGERPMAADNRKLATFNLEGIEPAPRGVPQIEVSFDIDSNGILSVKAKDVKTGKEQHVTVQSSNLTDEEIERYKKEAEMYAEEDAKKKALADAKNSAETALYNINDILSKYGDNESIMSAEDKQKLEEYKQAISDAISSNDITNLNSVIDNIIKTKVSDTLSKICANAINQHTGGENQQNDSGAADGIYGSTGEDYTKFFSGFGNKSN